MYIKREIWCSDRFFRPHRKEDMDESKCYILNQAPLHRYGIEGDLVRNSGLSDSMGRKMWMHEHSSLFCQDETNVL
ncbi:hypothetical protein Mapa_000979 [Marchantia paleacea]|nr:hypothetical protein Mapa_000979 [Marchantia paleacea]